MPNSALESTEIEQNPHGFFTSLRRKLPTGEVIRFLLVGGSNTVIGFLLYAAAVRFYSGVMPQHKLLVPMAASLTAKPIGITVAFLCYKHFVFRTKGNYLKEYLRCFAVYGVSTIAELGILVVATKLFLLSSLTHTHAPYLAGIANSVIIAGYSYFAHKKFSFKR